MQVEQLLHGYNSGHHLIAGSVSLPLQDADLMSYVSDWSGYLHPTNKDSAYITAYPLEESSYYVLAKSWYADEMSRPGCVWTHSLLVRLEEMGQSVSFYELEKLFRRPKRDGEDFMSYTKPVTLTSEKQTERREQLKDIDGTRFMFLAAMLLDRRKPSVYLVEGKSEMYMELCLRLLQNIPFGIIRELKMCSGCSAVRKFGSGFFNLQFVTGKGESLQEPYPDKVDKPTADRGFQFWMDSVLSGRQDVGQVMHRFSSDIGNNAQKFLGVCNLLRLLNDRMEQKEAAGGFKELLLHLTEAFPEKEDGKMLKKAFLAEAVTHLFGDDKTFLVELATTQESEALDYQAFGYDARVQSFRKQQGPEVYVNFLDDLSKADYLNPQGKQLLGNALTGLTREEITLLARQNWPLFKSIVTLNSKVLTQDFWIELPPVEFLSLFVIFQRELPEHFEAWGNLLEKLLTIDTFVSDQIIQGIVTHVESYVDIALDRWNTQPEPPINKDLLKHCMKQKSRVILWMNKQESVNKTIRKAVRLYIRPDDSVVVGFGSNAWKAFVAGEIKDETDANVLVYVYVLAFNWYDFVALDYIRQVLPYIYEALSLETLNYSSWQQIEKFTGEVPFWRSWDNCRKVLIGVKDYCRKLDLSEKEVVNFTTNVKLNQELLTLWKKG